MADARRQRFLKRFDALKSERGSWDPHWREISDFLLPRRTRFLYTDTNQGTKKNSKIINSTGTRALRILASGLMAGLTSPSRPWFRLSTPDHEQMKDDEVRTWVEDVEEILRGMFHESNLYTALPTTYLDLGGFGSHALFVDEDYKQLMRCYPLAIGSYCLTQDHAGRVNGLYRECSYTVEQMMRRWGSTCSSEVKELFQQGHLDKAREILHVVQPNDSFAYGMSGPAGMPWSSIWIERQSSDQDALLQIGGYHEFPVMAPRWDVTGEDVYGSSPGMDCLGDLKAIQVLERRVAMAMELAITPNMNAPAALRQSAPSLLPGHINYHSDAPGASVMTPSHTVDPRVLFMEQPIQRLELRINQAFYADLFLMISQMTGQPPTAREVDERHEEKLLQLGPVHERMNDDLLDPLIDRAFGIALRRGKIPIPPRQLQGTNLEIEYISVMAQAQKLVGTAHVERLLNFATAMAQVQPTALDAFDGEATLRDYADKLGTPSKLVRSPSEVKKVRDQLANERKLQQLAQFAKPAADAAGAVNKLAASPMDPDSVLAQLQGAGGTVAEQLPV